MPFVLFECACPFMIQREVWCQQRRRLWWSGAISGLWGDNWWRSNLRMSKDTFHYLCRLLAKSINQGVEERLAVTIWKLATNLECRTTAELFGLGWTTVCSIVLETCKVITAILMPQFVKIPHGDALTKVVCVDLFTLAFHKWLERLTEHVFKSFAHQKT